MKEVYEFKSLEGPFTLPQQWREFLGPDVLSYRTTIQSRLKQLSIDHHRFNKVMRLCSDFCSWKSVKSQRLIAMELVDQGSKVAKRRATNLKKYGHVSPLGSKEIREKAESANIATYGHVSGFGSQEVQSKAKATMLERYGTLIPMRIEEISVKASEHFISKYGVNHPFKAKEVRDRAIQTIRDKYGISPMSDPDIYARAKDNSKAGSLRSFEGRHGIDLQSYITDVLENANLVPVDFSDYTNLNVEFSAVCRICGSTSLFHFYEGVKLTKCPVCSTSHTRVESDILLYVRQFYPDATPSKDILPGKREIDIYIPSLHIGFEINGAYSHNSAIGEVMYSSKAYRFVPKAQTYHSNKTICALSAHELDFTTLVPIRDENSNLIPKESVKLYHLWEHWGPHKLKSVVKAKLRVFSSTMYARSLSLRQSSFEEEADLQDRSHVLGHARAVFGFGLYSEGVLITSISFRRSSRLVFEICRNVSYPDTQVVGGFTRLLRAGIRYIKQHYPEVNEVITFADRDLTPDPYDSVYFRNGFSYMKDSGPTLSYYAHRTVKLVGSDNVLVSIGIHNRRSFQKHTLLRFNGCACTNKVSTDFYDAGKEYNQPFIFNPQLTEQQNLYKLHIHPLYNSGCHKYTLQI